MAGKNDNFDALMAMMALKHIIGSWDDPYIVFLCSLMDRHGPGGGCIKHNRQRNRSSIGGLPWNKYDYEHL